ncbi:MAG: hypothetical protein PHU23_18625 [Dehalococcoidales bacterium]|nr:hypothetical protein [Dehalococcoidales bacterium]
MLSEQKKKEILAELARKPLERILAIGITGSGKSFQWLNLANTLMPLGVKFRVIDTDNDIDFMLRTQFEHLLPENDGNVYVMPAYDWLEYEKSVMWVQQKPLNEAQLKSLSPYQLQAYKAPLMPYDWVVVDKANNAWSSVQNHFVSEVFGENKGEYFLQIRKKLWAGGDIGKSGKKVTSVALEALDGWKDWSVINGLYDDWINPIVYRIKCNVYATSDVETLGREEKDPEILSMFGDVKIKPAGQKKLGGQMHTIFLYIPGTERWSVSTLKDRSNRVYFKKTPLNDIYNQYLFAKAGWPLVEEE